MIYIPFFDPTVTSANNIQLMQYLEETLVKIPVIIDGLEPKRHIIIFRN